MNKYLLLITLVILLGGFFYFKFSSAPVVPIDITSNQPAGYVTYSWWRYIFEPFSLLSEYLLSATNWRKTIFSVYLWFLLISLFFKIKFWRATLVYFTIIALTIIFPLTCPKIHLTSSGTVVDFHSHTYYSHDALISPEQNLSAHRRAGFHTFFITEHDSTKSFSRFQQKSFPVFPGVQINTTDGISLLILSQKEFDLNELKNSSIKELIRKAHQKNMLVVLPHWWKWKKPPVKELIKNGIDGIEIYNTAYRSGANTVELIELARRNNLFPVGSTDWHGWGNYTNVWTVIKSTDTNILWQTKNRFLTSRVIVYNPQKELTDWQHLLEPYFIIINYLRSAKSTNIFFLVFWLFLISWLKKKQKNFLTGLKFGISLIVGIILLVESIKFILNWIILYPQNISLIKIAFAYFFLGLSWLYLAKKSIRY